MQKKRNQHALSREHLLFGNAVRQLRARRCISQEQLGHRSGLHRNYVGAVERGEINPTLKTMLRLCHGLALQASELMLMFEDNLRRDLAERSEQPGRPLFGGLATGRGVRGGGGSASMDRARFRA